MKKITLVFPSVQDLWEFKSTVQARFVEINIKALTIICECMDVDVELATSRFNAKILK